MLVKDLRQNVAQLKGLGAKACEHLARLQIHHIAELLQHYPVRYLDHLQPVSLQNALRQLQGLYSAGESYFYLAVRVVEHAYIPWRGGYAAQRRQSAPNAGQALKVIVEDGSGLRASLLCFGRNFLAAQMPVGSALLVAGKFQLRYGELQCANFAYELCQDPSSVHKAAVAPESGAYNGSEFACLLPLYGLTQGLGQRQLRGAIAQALQHFSFAIEDELPAYLQLKRGLLCKKEALRQIHFPASKELLLKAHRSLVYEELLVLMLLIQRRRLQQHRDLQRQHSQNFSLPADSGQLLQKAQIGLPFTLSEGQRGALAEILESFRRDVPMNRLLQGDVGSGKTIVALLSSLPWLEAGAQVVLMAPTEILARQLLQNFENLRQRLEGQEQGDFLCSAATVAQGLGQSALLSASVGAVRRREILGGLRSGKIRLLVGTHSLFSQAVEFVQLRYIIVDEQHRFGVEQRLALKQKALKGKNAGPPHVLLMSATPIPRSLALTLYGDLDISSIRSMPAQRKPIKTHLVRQGNDEKMYDFVRRELAAGRQAYFIYPLIAELAGGDDGELRSLEQMRDRLQEVFGAYRLGKVHGQMPQEEKERAMQAFRANELQLLLATTVVEVGVDVPNATVMVIEHAERFGLAQLHQLRGRVGRGRDQGYCFLVYRDDPARGYSLSELAKQRLLTLKESHDGFAIAEKDLELRGPGDLLGAEQSGSMDLHIASIPEDMDFLEQAKEDASQLLEKDYALLQASHQGLRQALLAISQESLDA